MNKAPRFLKEYAAYQKRYIMEQFPLMDTEIKQNLIDHIDSAEYLYKRGFITLDEAMRIVSCDYFQDLTQEEKGFC